MIAVNLGEDIVGSAERPAPRKVSDATTPAPSWTWSRLLMGDWNPIIRDPLDVLRILFFAGTIVWVVTGGAAADGLVASSLILLGGRLVSLPRFYDLSLIIAMTITGWGSALHLYGQFGWYDDVVHALMPLLVTPIVYVLLVRLGVLPQLRDLTQLHHEFGFFLIAFCFGMAIAGGWEVVEWWIDQWMGETRVKDAEDTAGDLTAGVYGSIGGGVLLIVWSQLGLPLSRVSGEAAARSAPVGAAPTTE